MLRALTSLAAHLHEIAAQREEVGIQVVSNDRHARGLVAAEARERNRPRVHGVVRPGHWATGATGIDDPCRLQTQFPGMNLNMAIQFDAVVHGQVIEVRRFLTDVAT